MKLLETYSRESKPKKDVKVGGRLHDSALGAIFVARVQDEVPQILKTINLCDQNVWAVTTDNDRTTVRGLVSSKAQFLTESKSEAREWQETWSPGGIVSKVCWLSETIDRDGAQKVYKCNEYLTEVMVGLAVSKLQIPHYIKTHDAWISDATGFILQEYGGTSLVKKLVSFSLPEFQSVVLQVLMAITIAQDKCHLKHHDLHLENVFVTELKDQTIKGQPLNSKKHWSYVLGPTMRFTFEHHGILAKLGDFGLASATDNGERFERVDMDLLDAGEQDWGQWDAKLEGHTCYDIVNFLSFFFLSEESSMAHKSHVDWARSIYAAIKGLAPEITCSLRGRPLRNREGHLTMRQILELPIFLQWRNATNDSLEMY